MVVVPGHGNSQNGSNCGSWPAGSALWAGGRRGRASADVVKVLPTFGYTNARACGDAVMLCAPPASENMVIDWWKSINEMEIIQTRATQRARRARRDARCAHGWHTPPTLRPEIRRRASELRAPLRHRSQTRVIRMMMCISEKRVSPRAVVVWVSVPYGWR